MTATREATANNTVVAVLLFYGEDPVTRAIGKIGALQGSPVHGPWRSHALRFPALNFSSPGETTQSSPPPAEDPEG